MPTGGVWDLVQARKVLALIEAADALGLMDELADSERTAEELSRAHALELGILDSFLMLLGWNGVMERGPSGGWRLTPSYRDLARSGVEGWLPLLRIEGWAARTHLNATGIVEALRGRRCRPEIDDQMVDDLARAMLQGARASAPHIARLPEWRDRRHCADLAGGSGGYSVMLCRLFPRLTATVYDRPEMLRTTARVVAEAGLEDRIALVPWDLTVDPVPAGHDSVLLSHVLHLIDAPGRLDLGRRIATALGEGDLVVIHDHVYEAPQPGSSLAACAVDWLSFGSCFLPDRAGLAGELAAAGLTTHRFVPVAGSDATIVVATVGGGAVDPSPEFVV